MIVIHLDQSSEKNILTQYYDCVFFVEWYILAIICVLSNANIYGSIRIRNWTVPMSVFFGMTHLQTNLLFVPRNTQSYFIVVTTG